MKKLMLPSAIAIVLSLASTQILQAQNIDKNRMTRDLVNMSEVLNNLFQTRLGATGGTVHVASGLYSFERGNRVTGNYLPGYGVIFTIPGSTSAFIFATGDKGKNVRYQFKYGTDKDREVTKESIVTRIKEFLRDYGSIIGQLNDDDMITVIYQNGSSDQFTFARTFYLADDKKGKDLPSPQIPATIYVTTKKADLESLRRESISGQEFYHRLHIKVVENEENEKLDLKIMGSILETTFGESRKEAFKISSPIHPFYLDGLGAVFYLDASYGPGFFSMKDAVINVRHNIAQMAGMDSADVALLHKDIGDSASATFYKNLKTMRSSDAKRDKQTTEAYKQFVQQLKETIVDYGRTLKSVQPDEQLYVSVSLSPVSNNIPDRIDLQVQKSVLERMDRGQISREEAIREVQSRTWSFYP